MIVSNPDILKCPHCGGLRRISSIVTGNNFDMSFWSDFQLDLPCCPSVSSVLRCPICKKYHFFHNSQIVGDCRTYGKSDFGELSYKSLKEALEQLKPKGKDEETLRMMILWAYNDLYGQMHNVEILPKELQQERQFFRENALALFRLRPEDTLLHAELFREMGEFDNSIALLKRICFENPSNHSLTIIEKAAKNDANVCIIESLSSSESRFPIEDSVGYVYYSWKDWDWEYVEKRLNPYIQKVKNFFVKEEDDEDYL